jgi:glycosyltransferase involved in cell wall biosynthesis
MRVAHFIQRYPPALGGSEAYFARLSRHLAAAGDEVTVFTTVARDLPAFWSRRAECLPPGRTWEAGVEVRRYSLWRWPGRRYLLKALSLIPHRRWQCLTLPCNPISWPMWRTAGRPDRRFDVVHASAFPYAWPIVCGLRLARRLGVPFVLTPFLHLGDPTRPDDPTRRAYTTPALLSLVRAADAVFVQTEGERRALREHGLPESKLIVQGLGVDEAECTGGDRRRARAAWQVDDGTVVIGHLANNSEEKGSADLLRAAQQLWLRGRRFAVVLAGTEMPNFRRFWRSFNPGGPVLRLGRLDVGAKRDFFAGVDLFALPSRSDSFGLVLLEAWANGLPCVAYRAGGVADVVRHEGDGLLAPCGDVPALAEVLDRLLTSPALRDCLGSAGRARVRGETWHAKLELVRSTYRELARPAARQECLAYPQLVGEILLSRPLLAARELVGQDGPNQHRAAGGHAPLRAPAVLVEQVPDLNSARP